MSDPKIYVSIDGQQEGPFSPAEVQQRIASGEVTEASLAWHEGMDNWMAVSSIPALAEMSGGAAPVGAAPVNPSSAAPTTPATAAPPPAPAGQLPHTPTSGLAIASLSIGIVSLLSLVLGMCCMPIPLASIIAIPGIITGHMAMGQIRDQPGRWEGRGLALGGLWTSYLALVIGLLLFLAMLGFLGAAVMSEGGLDFDSY